MGKLFDYLTEPRPSTIFKDEIGKMIVGDYENPDLKNINRKIRKLEMDLTFAKRKPNVTQKELNNLERKLNDKLSEREALFHACEEK